MKPAKENTYHVVHEIKVDPDTMEDMFFMIGLALFGSYILIQYIMAPVVEYLNFLAGGFSEDIRDSYTKIDLATIANLRPNPVTGVLGAQLGLPV